MSGGGPVVEAGLRPGTSSSLALGNLTTVPVREFVWSLNVRRVSKADGHVT
jgi:hypothetical protein